MKDDERLALVALALGRPSPLAAGRAAYLKWKWQRLGIIDDEGNLTDLGRAHVKTISKERPSIDIPGPDGVTWED